jgi:bifunctional DNA-binding transcriptional regulator/antitoxin component of YhaV-PrlF toxin-antitoxin module
MRNWFWIGRANGKLSNASMMLGRGQTTLPVEYRMKLGINEGDDLLIEETPQGLVVRRVPDLLDLAGVDAKYGSPEEGKKVIERMREEY